MAGRALRRIRLRVDLRRWFGRNRTGLVVGAAVVVSAAFALLLWRGPAWLESAGLRGLTPVQRETAVDAMRGRVIQLGAGLLAGGALVYTALNFRLSRESHVTDRYTKAIEQLGSEGLDVRLGAIYALERIMIDSARDHPTIVEVLAAYVREHSSVEAPNDLAAKARVELASTPGLATDVQAALTVLGRRPARRGERGRLNLRKTDLADADLRRADLTRADLYRADLTDADLTGANLAGVKLAGADLSRADLIDADVTSASLVIAILTAANLISADLTAANLSKADLTGADLTGATLTGADLTDANLTGAKLPRSVLDNPTLPANHGAQILPLRGAS